MDLVEEVILSSRCSQYRRQIRQRLSERGVKINGNVAIFGELISSRLLSLRTLQLEAALHPPGDEDSATCA